MPPFRTTYRISWVDTDAAQVVHFSNYLRIFERAEEEMYQQLGFSFNDITKKHDYWLPRIEAYCEFKTPTKYGDTLETAITTEQITDKAVKYNFNMTNQTTKQLAAQGHVIVVIADKKLGKAIPLPKELAEKLTIYRKT